MRWARGRRSSSTTSWHALMTRHPTIPSPALAPPQREREGETATSRAISVVAAPAGSETVLPDDNGPGERSSRRSEHRTYEIGTMLILRNGVASTGGIFGASPFVTMTF